MFTTYVALGASKRFGEAELRTHTLKGYNIGLEGLCTWQLHGMIWEFLSDDERLEKHVNRHVVVGA